MKLTWIMQQNLVRELDRWLTALKCNGSDYVLIDIVPFSDDLPDVLVDGPAIVYGSTTMIKNAPNKSWRPGVFFNPENFRCSTWAEKYGNNMFNSDGYVCTLDSLATNLKTDDLFFMRPDNDLKDFSGSVVSKEGILNFYESVSAGGFTFDKTLHVFVAPVKEIHKEWRIFIVDGKPVAWSQYRFRSMLLKSPDVPQRVIDYAQEMASIWSPEKAFVMDICENMYRELKILELNCFNASGVYECHVPDIVKAVEEMIEMETIVSNNPT